MATVSEAELQRLLESISSSAKGYDETQTVSGFESRAAIRSAARDLLDAVTTPEDHVWQLVLQMTGLVALRTCLSLGVFQHIPVEGDASAEEIGRATNATPSLVERLLRVLVGSRFIEQSPSDSRRYKHTKFSLPYRDISVPGPGTFFQAMYDVYLRPTLSLDKWIQEKYTGEYAEPSSTFDNPFVSSYGKDGQSAWDVMAGIPDVMKTFQLSLKATDQMMPPAGSFYDFDQFKAIDGEAERIQIVDVGGGYGKVLTDIVKATPSLEPKYCVLQDVDHVIGIADAARDFGLQTMTIDFHKEQPVKGARAYYMRFISHDHSDHDIINILSHVAGAMAPDSKLLLADCVMPDRLQEATVTAGVMDQLMFCIGGKERTASGFKAIFEPNGLEIVSVNQVPGSTGAIVEARLKP